MSLKEFLIHMVAITCGLLIAVGIEGLVELHREHVLVREARQTLREEIEYNSRNMGDAVTQIENEKAVMVNNIKMLTRVIENPKDKAAQQGSINVDFSLVSTHETAWKTAQATGALAFMPYAEAQRYADLYGGQQAFRTQEEKILEDEAAFVGVMTKTDFGHSDITPEQASLALERFGVWRQHLVYLGLMAKVTALSEKAFLEGKEAPTSMSEGISK